MFDLIARDNIICILCPEEDEMGLLSSFARVLEVVIYIKVKMFYPVVQFTKRSKVRCGSSQ